MMSASLSPRTTFRKNTAETLMRTRRDLAEAQRIALLGSWEWDIASGAISTSEEVIRIVGARLDNHADFMNLLHPADRPSVQKAIDTAFSGRGAPASIECRICRHDGDMRVIHARFEVLFSDSGAAKRAVGTFQDVTDLRKVELEIQRMRAQCWHADRISRTAVLIGSLAHELSQPLAAILSNAQAGLQFLSHNPPDQYEIREILKDIVADAKRAGGVIAVLRSMIRQQETSRVRVDAAELVREVLALLRAELAAQQVTVETACEAGCFLLADKTQIEQVILNLILNGIEAMQERPVDQRHLRIEMASLSRVQVQVAVRDSGVGIPLDKLEHVFDAFWTMKEEGLGLGLAVCRSIVEAHGGRIRVERNNGHGASFFFTLPLAA
jgi:PAS domain S-box-containing protein